MNTVDRARGKWRGILAELGVPAEALTGKHGPCPKCGGTDRFRFDNRQGKGTWICSVCGAGDGFRLLENVFGWEFKEAAEHVDRVVGAVRPERPKPEVDDSKRRALLRATWKVTRGIQSGDVAERYLRSRGLFLEAMPGDLRTADLLAYDERSSFPALVAMVRDVNGEPVTLHRTFLQVGGTGKAPVDCPRKLMPGPVPKGSAVRLAPAGADLGIAEGVETALAASLMFGLPVWAAISAPMLASWNPPEGVQHVKVCGDHDPGGAGQKAAWELGARLIGEGYAVTMEIPRIPGRDWLDEWADRQERQALEKV
jgi:putative DNA primase/helicase